MQEPAEKAVELFRHMNKHRRDIFKAYQSFTSAIKKGSSIEGKYQSLILIACSILSQCDMCISLHVQNAATQGATKDEIIDAGLLAVAMGGSPKMMYMKYVYEEVAKLFDEEE
ncbi:carboxymuconolactone decarboxylase family protein [Salidesulfovibrio onnuriiensis]|uniref:carboxymuconolactone decarboxylase family protein n=1 Tax=Salidesulfovibrio onnuriiensis TaxID=2583823 RepID=UPI0011CC8CB9|nr:carboxymuconolactone decarboxylase family protein [Salidesulfovibrio onnuriiensis]